MIPILYLKSETQFLSNGLGRLVDCISCEVTEERNGIYECEFTYPVTGEYCDLMSQTPGVCTICVTHDDKGDRQPFDIYKHSTPINGIVTFNARHISYRLNGITVNPFTASSCLTALQGIGTHSMQANPFTFWTDKSVNSAFALTTPANARALLGGVQGSILDVYGKGEYEFDKFAVKLHLNRGANNGVEIRYGKNLTDYVNTADDGQYYNSVSPFWKGEDGTVVMLPEGYIQSPDVTGDVICASLDMSSYFDSAPTEAELRAAAYQYMEDNEPYDIEENITFDFAQLWQTDEYKDYAPLERVSLCDTVSIYFNDPWARKTTAKVIRVVYDVLREQYVSMELGKAQTTLQEAILQTYGKELEDVEAIARQKVSNSELAAAIDAATQLITGATGGHVVINTNANGEPEEILIMDTDDKATAVNVWRFNLNGLAHSSTGYNGPFSDIALTADGKINANMILTGYLVANIIKGGTLSLGGANNDDGIWIVNDANGNEIARGDKDGVTSKALTATDYIYLNGGAGSYFKMPLNATYPDREYMLLSANGALPFLVRLCMFVGTQSETPYIVGIVGNTLQVKSETAGGGFTSIAPSSITVGESGYSYRVTINGGQISIYDSSNTLQAKLGRNFFTGNAELQLGGTTLSESQLQQLLALI